VKKHSGGDADGLAPAVPAMVAPLLLPGESSAAALSASCGRCAATAGTATGALDATACDACGLP